ncbi:MAG: prepilin-type N-terminal cleavage/methylation domain-containing protein [bacterium]
MRNVNKKGFTLIELLIVIAIIGILAGILIAVINPAQQRLKANQAVMRSSVSKACLAAVACVTSSSTGNCTNVTFATLGVDLNINQPTGASYAPVVAGGALTGITGTMGTCVVTCNALAAGVNPVTVANCVIQ